MKSEKVFLNGMWHDIDALENQRREIYLAKKRSKEMVKQRVLIYGIFVFLLILGLGITFVRDKPVSMEILLGSQVLFLMMGYHIDQFLSSDIKKEGRTIRWKKEL